MSPATDRRTSPALSDDDFREAVAAAVRAPSMLNCQPWRFRHDPAGLEILADPLRALKIIDPLGWGVRLACGAAAANAAVSLAAAGVVVTVQTRPDVDRPEVLIRLVPQANRRPTPRDIALAAAITRRHSNRDPFVDATVPPDIRRTLREAASEHGAWLELLVGRGPLAVVSEIVRAADHALNRDPQYVAEVATWSGRAAGCEDGVPAHAGGLVPQGHDLLAMRDLGGASRPYGRDYESDPLIGILGTTGDTVHDQLMAGYAMAHVLLAATDAGLSASLLSQPIEVPAARDQLRRGLGRHGAPQMVIRLGYGAPTPHASRRPLDAVITS